MAIVGVIALAIPLVLLRGEAESVDVASVEVETTPPDNAKSPVREREGMVWIPPGEFLMGSTDAARRDEWPIHNVTLDGFWIDKAPVTNAEFKQFADATGHVTTAERRGSSLLFDAKAKAWKTVEGANWQRPTGPDSSLFGLDRHPVVHVSWHDAVAYAKWAGKRLVTEAEYERAARGGRLAGTFAWGDQLAPDNRAMANFWQGRFPDEDHKLDHFGKLAPVGRFPSNAYGLVDIAGNAWCWTADGYDAEFYGISPSQNPTGPNDVTQRVLRGGSYLTPASSMRVATRGHADAQHTSCDVGFRCAR